MRQEFHRVDYEAGKRFTLAEAGHAWLVIEWEDA